MNRQLRRRHGRMIVVITALVVVIFVAAIALRPATVATEATGFLDDVAGGSGPLEPAVAEDEGAADGS